MAFKDLVKKNRSYRLFDMTKPITKEQLLDFIDTTRFAPASVNIQPIVYKISCTPEMNAKIRPYTFWAKMLKDYSGPDPEHDPTAYIAICTDKSLAPNAERFDRDIGIVAQTIMLSAVEAGFGGCMIGNFKKAEISEIMGITDDYDLRLVLALGAPAEEIILEELEKGADYRYYRDENNVHHVPKRKLEDIII